MSGLLLSSVLTLISCSTDGSDQDLGISKAQAVKNFEKAIASVNAPQNLKRRKLESDQELNDRRIGLLAGDARQLLKASGFATNYINDLSDAEATLQALKIYSKTKIVKP